VIKSVVKPASRKFSHSASFTGARPGLTSHRAGKLNHLRTLVSPVCNCIIGVINWARS